MAKGSTCSMETGAEEKEPSPVVTLVDAIMEKYCSGPEEFYNPEVLPVFRVIKEHSPKSKPGKKLKFKKDTFIFNGNAKCQSNYLFLEQCRLM